MSNSAQSATHTSEDLTAKSEERIEILDLRPQYSAIRTEITEAVERVFESQHFILGSEVMAFEEEIAAFLSAGNAISCASGSDALILALMAAGIGPGDEVITSPFTFVATAGAIARVGATPVFADIIPETFNIDSAAIQAAITDNTRAIIPVHLYGFPAELDPILEISEAKGIVVIEDAAQAINAVYESRRIGTIGKFGCFSFFPSKNLGCAGDGGLVTTENKELAERLRMLRVHGSRRKYYHEILGVNSRLDALQAAILRVKLKHLENWTAMREARASYYRELFEALNLLSCVQLPPVPNSNSRHVYHQFTIRCQNRNSLQECLQNSGIRTEVHYPGPLHLQPAFEYAGYREGDFPNAERACKEVLSLPMYPEITPGQQQRVVETIAEFYDKRRK